jgi:hypothetical protein
MSRHGQRDCAAECTTDTENYAIFLPSPIFQHGVLIPQEFSGAKSGPDIILAGFTERIRTCPIAKEDYNQPSYTLEELVEPLQMLLVDQAAVRVLAVQTRGAT